MYTSKYRGIGDLGDKISKEYGSTDTKKQMIATAAATAAAGPYGWVVGAALMIASFIPGLNKVMGKLFKKATHMESCMRWWTDSNIRSMAGRVKDSSIPLYYHIEDPVFAAKYKSDMDNIVSSRVGRLQDLFLSMVRSTPDIDSLFRMQCASMPQGQKETKANIDPIYVASIWNMIRQSAQEQEHQEYTAKIEAIKMQIIQKKRDESTFFLPVETKTKNGVVISTGIPGVMPAVMQKRYTSGGSEIINVGPAIISREFPIVPKVK